MKPKKQREIEDTIKKINHLIRHIKNVEDNSVLLGTKLIEQGEIGLGKQLIANGFIHDASKFHGIEFEHLSSNNPTDENSKLKLKMAVHHHNSTNSHHPESYANGINDMPDVYICEMVCDWKSRSEEFGTNLREWIDDVATSKWGFTTDDEIYKKIMKYVNMLCDRPFDTLTK